MIWSYCSTTIRVSGHWRTTYDGPRYWVRSYFRHAARR